MAKNKKQNRKPSQSERGQQAQQSSMEAQAEQPPLQVTPSDMPRKGRQKSFGHN